MKTLRLGIIGPSGRGSVIANALLVDDNTEIVAAADIYQEGLEMFQKQYGENTFVTFDYRELIARDDLDAIFVCSPDFCHEEHAIAALKGGKAVYLEKPIAISIEAADRILETAKLTGSKLFLGHNMRYFPSILTMKNLIDHGAIGDLQAVWCRHFVSIGGDAYFKDWHSKQDNVTGLLLQKGAHDIDVIHWLSGSYTESVVAMGKLSVYNRAQRNTDGSKKKVSLEEKNWPPFSQSDYSTVIDVEDHTMILMQLRNGVQASYTQCHYTPDYWRNYTFIGTEGRIENFGDSGSCEIRIFRERHDSAMEPSEIIRLKPEAGSHGGSDPAIVKSFIDFVRKGITPNSSPPAARYAVAVGTMATESLRTDNSLRIIPKLDREQETYFENGQVSL